MVLPQAVGWLHLAQDCGLGSGLLMCVCSQTRGHLGILSSWQMNDRCTRAQPNHAMDLKSPLSHSTAKANNVAKSRVSGTGKDVLLTVGGERSEYFLPNTPVSH